LGEWYLMVAEVRRRNQIGRNAHRRDEQGECDEQQCKAAPRDGERDPSA